jgi:hypothetical protein
VFLVAGAAAVLVAGCDGGGSKPTLTLRSQPSPKQHCPPQAVVTRQLARLHHDIARLRRIANAVPASQQPNGNNAVALATNRFLLDESNSGVGVYVRSRLIDYAAAIVNTVCQPCWGSLEANRPVGGGGRSFNNQPLDCTRRRR